MDGEPRHDLRVGRPAAEASIRPKDTMSPCNIFWSPRQADRRQKMYVSLTQGSDKGR